MQKEAASQRSMMTDKLQRHFNEEVRKVKEEEADKIARQLEEYKSDVTKH